MTRKGSEKRHIRTLAVGLVSALSVTAVLATPADAAKKKTTKRPIKRTTKPKPAPATEVPTTAAPTTAAPTTLAAPATTAATPLLALAPSNGLKPGSAIAAGTYEFKVGTYTARVGLPAAASTDVVDPNTVLFNVGKRQLAFLYDLQTFEDPLLDGKDIKANLRPFYPNSAAYEAKIRAYPFVDFKPVTDVQVGSLSTRRHAWDLTSAAPNKSGNFTIGVPRIGAGFIPLSAYFDDKEPTTNVHFISWSPDGKPLDVYVSVPKGEDPDAFLKSTLLSLQ
jgi:hypothetical protein